MAHRHRRGARPIQAKYFAAVREEDAWG